MAFLTKLKAKTAGLAGSRRFDGSAQFWKTASTLDLSGTQKITVSFWMIWNTFSNADATKMCEQSVNVASHAGFLLDPDSSTGLFGCYVTPAGGVIDGQQFPRPSAGSWHHYALMFDTSQATNHKFYQAWVDGVAQTLSFLTNGSGTGNLGNDTVYFMCRAGTSQFGAGSLSDFAIYTDVLSPPQVEQLYRGVDPRLVAPGVLKGYWDMASGGSAMPDLSGNGNQLTSTAAPSGSASVPPQLIRGLPTSLARFSPVSSNLLEVLSDSLTVSDTSRLGYGDALTDILNNWADTITLAEVLGSSNSDNLNNWADLYVERLLVVLPENLSDSLTFTDSIVNLLSFQETLSDNANNLADLYSARLLVTEPEVLTDSLTLVDALATHVDPAFYLSDQLVMSESIAVTFPQPATSVPSLSFQVSGPGLTPDPQTINVFNALLGPLTFSITTDVPWIQVTPVSGTAPEDVQVSINTLGMEAGAHTGHIFVFGSGPAIVTVTFVIGPGDVTIQANGNTIGVIHASGAGETSFLDVLYRYANLTLPYNPQDPGLQYQYDNSTLEEHVILRALFFNLLNEPSEPLLLDAGTAGIGFSGAISGGQLFECLDVRLFGAVGDGKTDDTAAVQRALDQASKNYQAQIAIGFSTSSSSIGITGSTMNSGITGTPGPLGSTVVCIPSGVYCLVYPRHCDGAQTCQGINNTTGTPAGDLVALFIDDGVTLQCDGGLILGFDYNVLLAQIACGSDTMWILENREAFVGGPQLNAGANLDYNSTLLTFETGPRNSSIRVTGLGFMDGGAAGASLPFQTGGALNPCFGGAIRFCKCDRSQVDSLVIQNIVGNCGVYWGHSEHAIITGLQGRNSYGGGTPTGGASGLEGGVRYNNVLIIADFLRKSDIYANHSLQNDGFIQEYACFHTDIHDNTARLCGIPCYGTHFFADLSFLFCWQFAGDSSFDGNRYANHYADNRGLPWVANTVMGAGLISTPTSYAVGNHVWMALPGTTQIEANFYAGITGPTEPDWAHPLGTDPNTNLPYVLDAVTPITGALLGFWEQRFAGFGGQYFVLPFYPVPSTSLQVFLNGTLLNQGTDWNFANIAGIRFDIIVFTGFTANPTDILTVNMTTQIKWVDLGLAYISYPDVPACMQFLGNEAGNDTYALGVRIIANQVSDNYMDGIGYTGLKNGQISHSLVMRNWGAGIRDLDAGPGLVNLPSVNMQIIDNYAADNAPNNAMFFILDQSQIITSAAVLSTSTVDNAQVSPTITRVGVTTGTQVTGETPTGTINGVNTIFTLAHKPIAGSLAVFRDGSRTSAFTLTGVAGTTLTFTTAPATSVTVDYQY